MGCYKDEHHERMHCEDLFTDTLGTGDSCRIYVPVAFTPNGDYINDVFMPATFSVKSIRMEIYDACDRLVYVSTGAHVSWNPQGGIDFDGRYAYRLQALTNEHHHIGLCGEFMALRCLPVGLQMSDFIFSDQLSYQGAMYNTSDMLLSCD